MMPPTFWEECQKKLDAAKAADIADEEHATECIVNKQRYPHVAELLKDVPVVLMTTESEIVLGRRET